MTWWHTAIIYLVFNFIAGFLCAWVPGAYYRGTRCVPKPTTNAIAWIIDRYDAYLHWVDSIMGPYEKRRELDKER